MQTLSSSQDESRKRIEGIGWYDTFDGNKASSTLSAAKREANSLKDELRELPRRLNAQNLRVDSLSREASLGLDPRYWFSSERSDKKLELRQQKMMLAHLIQQKEQIQNRSHAKDEQVDAQQAELDRYRVFDRLEAEAVVKALKSRIVHLKSEIEQVGRSKEEVDQQLRAPLAELGELTRRKQILEREIGHAESFERRLSSALNSYERKMIHDECGASLGESKPARVIWAKRQEVDSVDRNIVKLRKRLESIAQRASRVIKTLVIDGNNLCYEQRTFIGTVALQAVARKLARDYAVLIVFDATIRRGLQMKDQEIAARFGDTVKIHVVASTQKADETLLDSASDPNSYVISNDRFVEFPEKPAVREKRLIRHEILNGKVFVHDLNLSEDFLFSN